MLEYKIINPDAVYVAVCSLVDIALLLQAEGTCIVA